MKLSDITIGKHYVLLDKPHFDDVFLCTKIDSEAIYGRWWRPMSKKYGKVVRIVIFALASSGSRMSISECPEDRVPDGKYRLDH
jgi:hypothetical protein